METGRKDTDTILDLVNELKTIEKQSSQLNKLDKKDVALIYGSFSERITTFAKKLDKNKNDSQQHRKVLAYLYAAVLSKKHFLEINEDSLVIDVAGLFNLVNKDIQALRDLQKQEGQKLEEDSKIKVIQKSKARYKQLIDKKIEEGNHLIQKEIIPEFDKISDEIQQKLDDLIKEVLALEKAAEEDKNKLIQKRHELENQLVVHQVANSFRFLGIAVSLFGPVGMVTGAAIAAGTSVGESFALSDQTDSPQLKLNPEDLKYLDDNLIQVKEQKINQLKEMLQIVSEDLAGFRKENLNLDEFRDLEDSVGSIQESLKTATGADINKLQQKLDQALSKKAEKLCNIEEPAKNPNASKLVTRMQEKIGSLKTLGINAYNELKNDKSKIGAVNNAIQQIEGLTLKLQQYEDAIHDTIAPMMNDMEVELKNVTKSFKDKSQVSLDVTKWKVVANLKNLKLQIHKMTQGFKVDEKLGRCIEKEEEAINTMIQIYDRFESFRDQQNLANYIENICSPSASLINVTDKDLNNTINSLEIDIRSNIIIKEYALAVEAPKQWVFPFAQNYLKELKQPEEFKPENNLENRVNETKTEIDKIKRNLALYKGSIQKSDEFIYNGEFNSKYHSTRPFYVWPNVKNNEMITKLLNGEPALTKADILGSPKNKFAIKFSLLEVNFKAKNKTLQKEINENLKQFKISAEHLGNSYYKIGQDQFYTITNPSFKIEYTLEKKEDGTPVEANDVYRKIKVGSFIKL